MMEKKTLPQREKELQCLLATPGGREELQQLEFLYQAAGANSRPARASVITYILVHEREHGLIRPETFWVWELLFGPRARFLLGSVLLVGRRAAVLADVLERRHQGAAALDRDQAVHAGDGQTRGTSTRLSNS